MKCHLKLHIDIDIGYIKFLCYFHKTASARGFAPVLCPGEFFIRDPLLLSCSSSQNPLKYERRRRDSALATGQMAFWLRVVWCRTSGGTSARSFRGQKILQPGQVTQSPGRREGLA